MAHTRHGDGETGRKPGALDGLIRPGKRRAGGAGCAVRLVRLELGGESRSHVTDAPDPLVPPIPELARLYALRWDFELAAKLVERRLGLHILRGCKHAIVQQQVRAAPIIGRIPQAPRLEVAGRAGAGVDEVSMGLLVRYLPRFAGRGLGPVAESAGRGRTLGLVGPSRRIAHTAPEIPPEELVPAPPDPIPGRKPGYANRKRRPRGDTRAAPTAAAIQLDQMTRVPALPRTTRGASLTAAAATASSRARRSGTAARARRRARATRRRAAPCGSGA